jgi:glycosyltransferase involved in cell wall biosynthesis
MPPPQEILYCSTLCSSQVIKDLFVSSKKKPVISIQKFHHLLTRGLVNNGCNVTALTAIPVNNSHERIFWKLKPQNEIGITIIYPFFLNIIFVRQTLIFINTFFIASKWCIKKKGGFIICDALNLSVSSSARLTGFFFRVPVIAIITDLPVKQIERHSKSQFSLDYISMRISNSLLKTYNGFVFLTEKMNPVINIKKRPFVIVEGISDGDLNKVNCNTKAITRNIIYSGALLEKNGIVKLLEAFRRLEFDDIRLIFYGAGELESYLSDCMKQDPRILYYGMQPNNIVVEAQICATLLVNPRASNEEYTKYSFPSKNMEYMASGTPLVTTALQGIPQEYYPYLYVFDDETTNGIFNTLNKLLSLPGEELVAKGRAAKEFVCTKKNGNVQSCKVLNLLSALD